MVSALDLQNQYYNTYNKFQSANLFYAIDNTSGGGSYLSPFEDIITATRSLPSGQTAGNYHHITVHQNIVNFIVKKITGNPATTACNEFCNANPEITGSKTLCYGGRYLFSVDDSQLPAGLHYEWRYDRSVLTQNYGQGTPTLSLSVRSSAYHGPQTLRLSISKPGCPESLNYSFSLWVGKPKFHVALEPIGSNYVRVNAILDGQNQEISNYTWTKISGDGNLPNSQTSSVIVNGFGDSWEVTGKVTLTNPCGTTSQQFTVTPPPPQPCGTPYYSLTKTSQNNYQANIIIDPCGNTPTTLSSTTAPRQSRVPSDAIQKAILLDYYGHVKRTYSQNNFSVDHLHKGIYILNVQVADTLLQQKVLIKKN